MASRGPEIRLLTDDPNPENRDVAHADPITWTRDHRAEILRCLYTIMTYGCRNRPEGQVAKTRFKTWWSLVGWPVELAASLIGVELDFDTVFKATEVQDSKAAGIAAALHLLMNTFGEKWFRARDIRTILDKGELARATFLRSGVNNDAAIRAATAFLELVEELTGKRNRSPITNVIGKTLAGITDRPVNLDDTTRGILRSRLLHGNNEFSLEIHQRGPDGKYSRIPTAEQSGSGPPDPPIHPEEADFDDQVAQGGSGGSPDDGSAQRNQKNPPNQPVPKKRRSRNEAAEKIQPKGELDETW
jgi:hypothetical protein